MAKLTILNLLLTCSTLGNLATALYTRSVPVAAHVNSAAPLQELVARSDREGDANMSINSWSQTTSTFGNFLSRNMSRNKKPKLVFIAGVEGAGHHLLETIMKHFDYCSIGGGTQLFSSWAENRVWKEEDIPSFTAYLQQHLKAGCINVLPAEMSYPDGYGAGASKEERHAFRMNKGFPRMGWIRTAAQGAGADFHVMYLHRPFADCLAADCLHRKFETCPLQAETLDSNAFELVKQLESIPLQDRSCFRYGNPESMEKSLRSVFGKTAEQAGLQVWEDHPSKDQRKSEKDWDLLVKKLEPREARLENICRASSQVAMRDLSLKPSPRT